MKKAIKRLCITLIAGLCLAGVLFYQPDKSVAELTPKYAQPPSAFLQVMNMKVHYRDEGNPQDSLPIVLLHGTGASLHTFDDWADDLKNKRRVVRMDLPAFGLTGPFPDRDYSIVHYVSFVQAFLKTLGVKKCILGGNSLGGQIAWRVALADPKLVDQLMLIDASGYPIQSTSKPLAFQMANVPVVNQLFTFITPRSVIASSVKNVYADKTKVNEALIDRYFELSLREGNRQAFIDRLQTTYDTSFAAAIPSIHQPTLIIWGEKDALITPESAHRFHRDLPNSTLVLLPNTGHVPMEERPLESLEAVYRFLEDSPM